VLTDFSRGFSFALGGLKDLSNPALRPFVVIPLVINVALFAVVIWVATELFSSWLDSIFSRLPDWLGFLDWLLWPLFIVTVLLMVFYLFTVVANLLGSPFNGLLSEKAERLLVPGTAFPDSRPLWKEMLVAPWIELRKLLYVLLWAIPLLLLFLVPGVNAFAPFLWWAFGAWVLSLEYMEYPLSNHALSLTGQRRLLSQRRALTLGFGTAVLLLTLVPVVNFVVMPAAVIGATRMWALHLRPQVL
jgi:CysZ protein